MTRQSTSVKSHPGSHKLHSPRSRKAKSEEVKRDAYSALLSSSTVFYK